MPGPLPPALVDLLREMRAAGISIQGLMQATGLAPATIIKYTSGRTSARCECGRSSDHGGNCSVRRRTSLPGVDRSIGERSRRWTDEADAFVRQMWPIGATAEMLEPILTGMLGYQPTLHAVMVRAGKLGVKRAPGRKNTDDIATARRAYWERWRRGEVTNNRRCPRPLACEAAG